MRKIMFLMLIGLLLAGNLAQAAESQVYQLRLIVGLVETESDEDEMQRAEEIIRHRLSGAGWDADVTLLETGIEIIVEGSQDELLALAPHLINLITGSVLLEFVDFSALGADTPQPGDCILTTAQLEQARTPNPIFTCDPIEEDGEPRPAKLNPATDQPFVTVITGEGLEDVAATPSTWDDDAWVILFTLNDESSQIFGDFTESHIGQPLAIVLNGEVLSAPTINARIEGSGIIEGNFTQAEAETLAIQLRYGSLPVPLEVREVHLVPAK